MSEQTVEEFKAGFGLEPDDAPPPEGDTAKQTDQQTRDEAGRFAAKTAEPAAPETTEPADAEPEEAAPDETATLLAGKYKTAADLEKAYLEAQSLLGGTSRAELDEFRALRGEFEQLREQLQKTDQPAYDPSQIDDWIEANPTQLPALAQQAIDTQDGFLYQKALAAWAEIDAIGATRFDTRAVMDAELKALRDELEPQKAALQQAQTTTQFAAAYETAKQRHQDFDAVLNGITNDTLQGIPPEVLAGLQSGDQASKERCLETLYRWTKAEQAGTLQAASAEAEAEQHANGQAAKLAAAVATTTATGERGPVTGVDEWKRQLHESDAFKKAANLI